MNAMAQAVKQPVANPVVRTSKSRKPKAAKPEVQAPVAAAPVIATPKPKAEAAKPEAIFTVVSAGELHASPWGVKLSENAKDPNVHLNHTAITLDAILANKLTNFTLTKLVAVLDRERFEGNKPKSDALLRSYVRDCLETLVQKIPGAITSAK